MRAEPLSHDSAAATWRGGRVVEGARLEIAFRVKSSNEGSNPSLSANAYNVSLRRAGIRST